MKSVTRFVTIIFVVLGMVLVFPSSESLKPRPTKTPKGTRTLTTLPVTITPSHTATVTATITPTITVTPTRTITRTPQVNSTPYPDALLCPSHNPTLWHSLWDSTRGCHYDHEHGQNPFTSQVASTFPNYDLERLLGGVQVGHTNPSSSVELTHKHGGFKWQVDVAVPSGCLTGFEGGTVAVKSYALQFHALGRQDVEHEARNHSSVALLALCKSDNPDDVGYMYVVQLQEYGERVMPYQGMVLPYPDNFQPTWDGRRGQYFTTECFGVDFSVVEAIRGTTPIFIDCRPRYDDPNNNNTIWTSKITGQGARPPGSLLFRMLFRGRDNYQRLDASDLEYPFTWQFVCGGNFYVPDGCRFNSSTFTVHDVMGDIPASWDGASFDLDPRAGRVTFEGFVDRFGTKMSDAECTVAEGNCYPIKLVSAFVGKYSSELSAEKVSNPTVSNTPERDIYFCNGVVCKETDFGAVPSGWLGSEN